MARATLPYDLGLVSLEIRPKKLVLHEGSGFVAAKVASDASRVHFPNKKFLGDILGMHNLFPLNRNPSLGTNPFSNNVA